jgi:hypothetical protein
VTNYWEALPTNLFPSMRAEVLESRLAMPLLVCRKAGQGAPIDSINAIARSCGLGLIRPASPLRTAQRLPSGTNRPIGTDPVAFHPSVIEAAISVFAQFSSALPRKAAFAVPPPIPPLKTNNCPSIAGAPKKALGTLAP